MTAPNGSQKTYFVTVNRAAPGGNNNLQSLTVVAQAPLDPPVYCEHDDLHGGRRQHRHQRHRDGASAGYRGDSQHQWAGTDDQPGALHSLKAPGSSTLVTIEVTAPNGSQKTYLVTVHRAAPGGNNNLQSLTVVAEAP